MDTGEATFEVGDKVIRIVTGERGVVLADDPDESYQARQLRGGYCVRVALADSTIDYYRAEHLEHDRS